MRCIAIDPGASTGFAVFEDRILTRCGVGEPWHIWGLAGGVRRFDRVILEKPEKYPNDGVSPQNLITLAISAGLAAGPFVAAGADLVEVKPKEWKGSVSKPISHGRSWLALTPGEQAVIATSSKGMRSKPLLDMLDAVALGQYAIFRGIW